MSLDLEALKAAVDTHGEVTRILVTRVAGSTPRDEGTSMLVWRTGTSGTIGGGAFEYQAIARARHVLDTGQSESETFALGPALGQCCGGAATLFWEKFTQTTLPKRTPFARPIPGRNQGMLPDVELARGAPPLERNGWLIETAPNTPQSLWVWGAGHVGQALVSILAPLPGFAITWIETDMDRFPAVVPNGVMPLLGRDPGLLSAHAPKDADHIILTYSHDLDLAICHALLVHGFHSCGLIGSATKWARFQSRLQGLGHSNAQIKAIACPIGDPTLGKHPQAIAVGVAAALLMAKATKATQRDRVG